MSLINDALKRAREQQKERPNPPPSGLPLQPVEQRRGSGGAGGLVYPALLLITLALAGWFFWQWARSARTQSPGVVTAAQDHPTRGTPANAAPAPSSPQTASSPAPAPSHPVVQVSTTLVSRTPAPRVEAAPAPVLAAAPAQPAPSVPVTPVPQPPAVVPAPVAMPPAAAPVVEAAKPAAAPALASQPPAVAPVVPSVSEPPPPAPVAAPAAPFPDLKLQAIFYRLNKPSVMINGKVVYTGELIEGAKVTRIERDHAEVLWKGETRPLHLR